MSALATAHPHGPNAVELAGADDGSLEITVNTRCNKTPLQPKPKTATTESFSKVAEWGQRIAGILNDAGSLTTTKFSITSGGQET